MAKASNFIAVTRMRVAYWIAELYQLVVTGHFDKSYVVIPKGNTIGSLAGLLNVIARKIDPTEVDSDCICPAMLLAIKRRIWPELTLDEFIERIKGHGSNNKGVKND